MASRQGYNYFVKAYKESSFGTSPVSYATDEYSGNFKLSYAPIKEPIEPAGKTARIMEMQQETIGSREHIELTIEGNATFEVIEKTISAWSGDDASPYIPQNSTTRDSYEIHRVYPDSVYTVADVFSGCVLKDLNITGEQNGLLNFTVVYHAVSMSTETDISGYANLPSPNVSVCDFNKTYLKFSDVQVNGFLVPAYVYDDADGIYSLELALTNEFIDDKHKYQNETTMQTIPIVKSTGTLSCTAEYQTTKEIDIDNLYGDDASALENIFLFTDGTNTIEFTIYGVTSEMTQPEPDRQLFEFSATLRIQNYCRGGSVQPGFSAEVS